MSRLPRPRLILPRGYQKPVKPVIDLNHALSKGLVGYWHLGETGATGTIQNLITNKFLTVGNGPLTNGYSHHGGQSTAFNGTNQYVSDTVGVQTYPFSMSGWFFHFGSNSTVPLGNLSVNAAWDGWYLTANASTGWNFTSVSNTTFSTGAVGANTRANAWDHVVCVATSATSRTIYVNGVQGTVDSSSSTPARTDHLFGAGASVLSPAANFWAGALEGVRFYNRVLSAQEAIWLYSEPCAGIYSAGPFPNYVGVIAGTFKPGWAYGATKTIGGVF